MKNILLLTDFSSNANNAIQYAIQFFQEDDCLFYLIHIHKSGTFIIDDLLLSTGGTVYDSIVKGPKQKLETLAEALKEQYKNEKHQFDTIIDFDNFTDAIKQSIQLKSIDLVVLGTNGATGAKEVVFGSNAINVIRKIDCPALIVPENYKYAAIENVLLPLDDNDTLKTSYFKKLLQLVKRKNAFIHFLRVTKTEAPFSEDNTVISEHLKENSKYCYNRINEIPLHYAVDCYLQIHAIDMTFLLVQKEGLFKRLTEGSSTTRINKKMKTPLFIFHT